MGAKSDHPGVEIHGNQIRINFRLNGKMRREPLGVKPTKGNMKWAADYRAGVVRAIKDGTFEYRAWFPDSKNAPVSSSATFNELVELWLKLKRDQVQSSTHHSYWSKLQHFREPLGDRPITDIRHSEVAAVVAGIPWQSMKTRNNALTPLRGVFDLAIRDRIRTDNPAHGIPFNAPDTPEPDPLTLDEVEQVLGYMQRKMPEPIHNYFELAIFSGMRPSEIIALRWTDVDFAKGTLRVSKASVDGIIKQTKTYEKRDIELFSRAEQALRRQRAITQLQGAEVFLNPITGEPFVGDKPPRNYWDTALRKLGLRHRPAYQARHTFATLNLMAGANPMWVARQMGHRTMQTTVRCYARWIQGADASSERSKLEARLGTNLGTNGESGGIPEG